MKVFPSILVPEALTTWAKTFEIPKIQNVYSYVDVVHPNPFGLSDVLYASCVAPHTDPTFPKWSLLWVIRNDGLIVSDTETEEYNPQIGSLFTLDIHSPHSCMPQFHNKILPAHDRLFMAVSYGCRVRPSSRTAIRHVKDIIDQLLDSNRKSS